MSRIRKRIAERLVAAQHTAAILTTFNEIDCSAMMALRAQHKERFQQKHGVGLGFMSFFAPRVHRGAARRFPPSTPRSTATTSSTSTTSTSAWRSAPSAGWWCRWCATPTPCRSPISSARSPAWPGSPATASSPSTTSQGGTFTISNGGVYGSLLVHPDPEPAPERHPRHAQDREAPGRGATTRS